MPLPKPPAEAFIEGERAAAPAEATAEPEPTRKDAIGRAKAALTKEPPLGAKTMFGETDMPGRVVRAAGDLFLPETWAQAARQVATMPIGGGWLTAPLKRIGAGAAAGAVTDTVSRGYTGAADFAQRLLTHGGEQAIGEVLPGALNFGLTQRAARPALKALTPEAEAARKTADEARTVKAKEQHEGDVQRIRQAHDAIEEVRGADFKKAKAADAERAAQAKGEHAVAEESRSAAFRGKEATRRAEDEAMGQRIKQQHAAIEEARATAYERAEAAKQSAHQAQVAGAKAAHATALRQYQQEGAATIAGAFKAQVPALAEFPSTEAGLVSMVSGRGPQLVSKAYDKVMAEIARDGKGRSVEVLATDAAKLGIRSWQRRGQQERGLPDIAMVDASQLAAAATGFWKKDHGVYRRSVAALDKLGLGDPEARAQYKTAQGLFEFAEKSQMLKGQKFNPQAAMDAFDKVKKLDTLRKRGLGDIDAGVIADVARRPAPALTLPSAPAPGTPPRPLAKPLVPPFRRGEPPSSTPFVPPPGTAVEPRPLARPFVPPFRAPAPTPAPTPPPGVEIKRLPKMGFTAGAAVAEIPFIVSRLITGHFNPFLGGAGVAGGLAARALSERPIAMRAPLSPGARAATRVLPQAMGQEAASLLGDEP